MAQSVLKGREVAPPRRCVRSVGEIAREWGAAEASGAPRGRTLCDRGVKSKPRAVRWIIAVVCANKQVRLSRAVGLS